MPHQVLVTGEAKIAGARNARHRKFAVTTGAATGHMNLGRVRGSGRRTGRMACQAGHGRLMMVFVTGTALHACRGLREALRVTPRTRYRVVRPVIEAHSTRSLTRLAYGER